MGVYYIPEVYKSIVEEKVAYHINDIQQKLKKNPETVTKVQQGLCILIEGQIEKLELNAPNIPEEEFNKKIDTLEWALHTINHLTSSDPNVLMNTLRDLVKRKVSQEEVIERARSMGIGVNDKEAIYIA